MALLEKWFLLHGIQEVYPENSSASRTNVALAGAQEKFAGADFGLVVPLGDLVFRLQSHVVAEAFEPLDQATGQAVGIEAFEVVLSQILIGDATF
jgi:hypothetical protein